MNKKYVLLFILINGIFGIKVFDNVINLNDDAIKEIGDELKIHKIDTNYLRIKLIVLTIMFIMISPYYNFYYFAKNISKFKYCSSNFLHLIKNPLLNPTFENAFNTYLFYLNNNKKIKNETKLFWNDIFISNNVNTPEIIGIIENGKINSKINDFSNCIIKPNLGAWGIGITNFDKNNIPKKDTYLIQKKVSNPKINAHFRILTIKDIKTKKCSILWVYLLKNKNINIIVSNVHSGGYLYEVKNYKFRKLDKKKYNFELGDFYSIELFNKAIEKAIKLHELFNTVIIGWDVKIDNSNYYFLEGNFAPGNILLEDYYFSEKFNIIKNIKYK